MKIRNFGQHSAPPIQRSHRTGSSVIITRRRNRYTFPPNNPVCTYFQFKSEVQDLRPWKTARVSQNCNRVGIRGCSDWNTVSSCHPFRPLIYHGRYISTSDRARERAVEIIPRHHITNSQRLNCSLHLEIMVGVAVRECLEIVYGLRLCHFANFQMQNSCEIWLILREFLARRDAGWAQRKMAMWNCGVLFKISRSRVCCLHGFCFKWNSVHLEGFGDATFVRWVIVEWWDITDRYTIRLSISHLLVWTGTNHDLNRYPVNCQKSLNYIC